MNDCLIIVPTRGRQSRVLDFYHEFIKNSVISDIIFVCDSDDEKYTMLPDDIIVTIERTTVPEKINIIAMQQVDNYKYIGFLGDDHIPRTYGWDKTLTESINNVGIAYGNDLHQGEALPTVCIMTSNIPKVLGYLALPTVNHFYIDNVWKDWGLGTNTLHYHNNVIIEHMHPDAKKAEVDPTYSITNSYIHSDHDEYRKYKIGRLSTDVLKIKNMMELN